MRIVCIFGDDTVASRERYFKIIEGIKKRGWEHVPLRSEAKGGVSENLIGASLFENERLFSVDNASKLSSRDVDWIQNRSNEHEGSLLLYFNGNLPAAIKKNLPKDTKFEEFKIRQEIFAYLDLISPQKSEFLITKLHEILDSNAAEFVLAMIARHMRDIAWIKSGGVGLSLPPWRKQKLERQAKLFTDEQLCEFIKNLARADVASKSGGGELTVLLDLAFIKLI